MAALTSNDLSVVPVFQFADKTVLIRDLLDYTDFGLTLVDVAGVYVGTQVQLSEVFHTNSDFNSPDIAPAVSLDSAPVAYPEDAASGLMITGDFIIDYSVRAKVGPFVVVGVDGTPGGFNFVIQKNLITDYPPVAGTVIVVTGCANPENNGTFTVTELSDTEAFYLVKVNATVVTEADITASATFEFIFEKSFTFCLKEFVTPEIKIEQFYSCLTGTLTSKDVSALGAPTTDVLTHTVKYPQSLGDQQPPDVVSTSPNVVVGPPIYTMTWTTIIQHALTYEYEDGTLITITLSGAKEIDVTCFDLCCLVDSLNAMYKKMAKEINAANRSQYTLDFTRAIGLLALIRELSERCNDAKEADKLVAELKELLEKYSCLCECNGCDGDSELSQIITPISTEIIGASSVSLVPIEGLDATNVQTAISILFSMIVENSLPEAANYGDYVFWDGTSWIAAPSIGVSNVQGNGATTVEYNLSLAQIQLTNTAIILSTIAKGDNVASQLTLKLKYTDVNGDPQEHLIGNVPCGTKTAIIEASMVFSLGASSVAFIRIDGFYNDGETILISLGDVSDIGNTNGVSIELSWPVDTGYTTGTRITRAIKSI